MVNTPRPFKAMLIKNLTYLLNNPIRSFTLYFINILSVLIGTVVNRLTMEVTKANQAE